MAETDIFPLTPDYPIARHLLAGTVEGIADSGRRFARLKRAPRLVHDLELRARSTEEKMQLEQWYRRFEKSWFSFRDPVFATDAASGTNLERTFSVEFLEPPTYALVAPQAWNLRALLADRVGAPLFSYPDPAAGHTSLFLEESELVQTSGSWTSEATGASLHHGGSALVNPGTVPTDFAQWVYAGYGFRVWAFRGPDRGLFEVLLDEVPLGTGDAYAATTLAASPLFTKLDVPLGLHRVKLRATNTRNAASSNFFINADALEVIP